MTTSMKRHVIPAMINWLMENDPKVYVGFITEHPKTAINPYPSEDMMSKQTLTINESEVAVTVLVLSIEHNAVNRFSMSDDGLMFQVRMRGVVTDVFIPYESVVHLSCPESGLNEQFFFELDFLLDSLNMKNQTEESQIKVEAQIRPKVDKPHLRLVK